MNSPAHSQTISAQPLITQLETFLASPGSLTSTDGETVMRAMKGMKPDQLLLLKPVLERCAERQRQTGLLDYENTYNTALLLLRCKLGN